MSAPTAYRLGDGAPVTFESATAIWTAVAREVLEETARRSGAITQSELSRQVQQRSGIQTRLPVTEWLLPVVAQATEQSPQLAGVLRPDRVAAPPARRTATRAPRQPAAPKREAPAPKICPTCFMQLPATGRCDTCG